MSCFCIALGAYALGLFTACFLVGWNEHMWDRYAGIAWRPTLDTTIARQPTPQGWLL